MKRHLYWGLLLLFVFSLGCASEKVASVEPKTLAAEPKTETAGVAPAQTRPSNTPAAVREKSVSPPPVKADAGQAPAPAATIAFEHPVHDFGSVGPSSSHSYDFAFTNTGTAILHIERFHAPCGCTIPELAKRDYAPGESGIIKVRYNAPASAATDIKPIFVYSNDPKSPQYELTIKAKVEVNVSISPDDISLLLDQPNAGMSSLTIRSKDGREFAITSITVSDGVMTIPFDRTQRASEIVLEPKVDMEKLKTTTTGLIQVRTDHPQSGTLMARFNAKPLFEVSRPRIILQNILPGEEILRDVWIRSNYDQKVEIETFWSSNEMMTIDEVMEEGNHLQIMVKIVPPADVSAAGRRYITDELTIRLTNGQELTIRCSGWFRLN